MAGAQEVLRHFYLTPVDYSLAEIFCPEWLSLYTPHNTENQKNY